MKDEGTTIKLTKKAVSDFLQWSTSRYNDYCGYGNKAENVALVYESLKAGYCKHRHASMLEVRFTVQCAGGVGENGSGRYWRTGRSNGDTYHIDCLAGTITAEYSKRSISFLLPPLNSNQP